MKRIYMSIDALSLRFVAQQFPEGPYPRVGECRRGRVSIIVYSDPTSPWLNLQNASILNSYSIGEDVEYSDTISYLLGE